jgi:hypothetical protein
MTNPFQAAFEEWRDEIFAAMTPRQRALLKNGRRVWVRVNGAKVRVQPAELDAGDEMPISFIL